MTTSSVPTAPYAEIKIYARSSRGRFTRLRWWMLWLTQVVFFALPWILWNGRPAVLFDLDARRFYLFNLVLYPQDFIYLTLLLIISALGLFFVTTLAGRVWCGFACPQTVYTKLFMWVEQQCEGDRSARMRRDAAPGSMDRLLRKTTKQLGWIGISLWTGLTFVAYFTPVRILTAGLLDATWGPWETFWVCFYALALYGNAGYLREQVCKHMCPYARFQSAMFDRDTLIIGYDAQRGEPRGVRSGQTAVSSAPQGDCVNCTLCVQVCPTGIDIRNGLQSNCIGCAACIDACDVVMDKIGAPRGLVRYATQNGMEYGWSSAQMRQRMLRPRALIYGALLVVLMLMLTAGLALRAPLKVNVIRDRGVLSRVVGAGDVENAYRLQLMNALERSQRYRIEVIGVPGLRLGKTGFLDISLEPTEERSVPVTVVFSQPQAHALAKREKNRAIPIAFSISGIGGEFATVVVTEPSKFLLP